MNEQLTESMINLDLRDIHVPETVSWWPLGIGWWFVLSILILSFVAFIVWLQWRKSRYSLRALSLQELEVIRTQSQSDNQTFKDLYYLLRKISRLLPDGANYNRDSGNAWFDYLIEICQLPDCSERLKLQISSVPYQADIPIDTSEMMTVATSIIENLPDLVVPDQVEYNNID